MRYMRIEALFSRSFSWRLMLLAAGVTFGVRPLVEGVSQFPWISFACVCVAVVVLHPVMDKDLPTLVGSDMLKSLRTYIGACLLIAAQYYSPGRSVLRFVIDANRK